MARLKILIVDDDTIILDSLCEFLTIEGYQTDGATTTPRRGRSLTRARRL